MLPAPETRAFLLVGYRFLADLFRDFHADEPPRLARPVDADFPFADLKEHDLARALFERTAQYVGVDPAEYHLESHFTPTAPSRFLGALAGPGLTSSNRVAGTYSVAPDGCPVISYDLDAVRDSDGLVATFAHELAHDLLHVADPDLPGPASADEHMTDLTAAYLGFGIFGANAAQRIQHFGLGAYETSSKGYLSVVEWGYALAIFTQVHGHALGEVRPHLSRDAEEALVQGHRELGKHHAADLDAIRRRIPLDDEAHARAANPRFRTHVEAPGLISRLLGRD